MKKKKSETIMRCAAAMVLGTVLTLACLTTGGTLAFLQNHTGEVKNSFTSGEITYELTLKANAKNANPKYEDSAVTMPQSLPAQKTDSLSVVFQPQSPTVPELKGYRFSGWHYDENCTKPYQEVSAENDKITVKYGDTNDSA